MQPSDPIDADLKEQVILLGQHYNTMGLLPLAEAVRLTSDAQLSTQTRDVMLKLTSLCIANGCTRIENYTASYSKSMQMAFQYISHPGTITGMPTAEETAEVITLATSCVASINTFCAHIIATATVGELDADLCAAFMADLTKMDTKMWEMGTREKRRAEFVLLHNRETLLAERELHPERTQEINAILERIEFAIADITQIFGDS